MRARIALFAALLVSAPLAANAQDQAPPPKPASPTNNAAATPPAPKPKKAWRRANKKTKEVAVTGPIATYPGFQMIDGGGSRVLVEVSQRVDVVETKSQGRIVFRLKGVQAPTRTNRLPLPTGFFATPVSRVQLVDEGSDVNVVIELRQPSDATHRVLDTPTGIVLQIDFPKIETVVAEKAEEPRKHAKRSSDTSKLNGDGAY